MGRPALTTEEWVAQATKTHKGHYGYAPSVYTGYAQPIEIDCPLHGVFTQGEHNHRNGAGCPKCGAASRQAKRSHSFASFLAAVEPVHGGAYTYPKQEVHNSRTKLRILCPEHGEFSQTVYSHLQGARCPKCAYAANGMKSQLGISEFMDRAKAVHGGLYTYVSGLRGMHKNVSISCAQHGVFQQTPTNHLKGAGCPRCANHISKGEAEVKQFIESLGVPLLSSSRGLIPPYELDMYDPVSKTAVEYNGLWFHREALVGDKHRKKYEACAAVGITLVQIFEDEWASMRPQVEHRLRALFGKCPIVGARKCTLAKVSQAGASAFLKAHHTQGCGTATKRAYGLYLGDQLVALATFGTARFGEGWELLRYCSIGRVVGGISRLVKAFRKDYPSGVLVSYADLRWGSGDAYGRAGFTLSYITPPDYWWADCTKVQRVSRYKLQPHKTGEPEKVYAEKHGFHKILGVGHKRWVSEP